MILTVTIPETKVTLETKDGTLPAGTTILLSVPVKNSQIVPVIETKDQEIKPDPIIIEPIPVPEVTTDPAATFDRSYENVEFRSAANRFDLLGNAMTLGLSDADWTIVLDVRFVKFGTIQRVIGSATASTAGSSLQIGTLENGTLWVDTFIGGLTAGQVELNRFYEIVVSHHTDSRLKIYVDKKLIAYSGIPAFHSDADIYIGRWLENVYADFDLKRIRIFPALTDDQVRRLK